MRLFQGSYDAETVYNDDPVSQAQLFADAGASWLHVVDLDAARTGEQVNLPVIAAIADAVEVSVQASGGVRSLEAAAALANVGAARVVIGTAAVENPEFGGPSGGPPVGSGGAGRPGPRCGHPRVGNRAAGETCWSWPPASSPQGPRRWWSPRSAGTAPLSGPDTDGLRAR